VRQSKGCTPRKKAVKKKGQPKKKEKEEAKGYIEYIRPLPTLVNSYWLTISINQSSINQPLFLY